MKFDVGKVKLEMRIVKIQEYIQFINQAGKRINNVCLS